MKKLLLTLIAVLAIGGFSFAQEPDYYYDFDYHAFSDNAGLSAFVQIEDVFVEFADPWDQIEIAAFVGEECRGRMFMTGEYEDWGDPHPIVDMSIYYDSDKASNEPVTFKMHHHTTGQNYVGNCINYEILTGQWYNEQLVFGDYDNAPILNFTPAGEFEITKDIVGWTSGEDGMHFYLISSPVANADPEAVGMYASEYDLYYFNQTGVEGKEWINQKSNTSDEDFLTLAVGKGYLYASAETTTLTFRGTPYEGDGIIDLVYDADATCAGFNLIGNPYTVDAYLDRDEFYRMDPTGTTLIANDPSENETLVNVMEGIFVCAAGEGESVGFDPVNKKGVKAGKLAINVNNGRSLIDRAIIRFEENHMLPKFQLNENSTKVYFTQNDKDLAVVSSNGQGEMPLNFKAETAGTYNFSVSTSNVNFNYLHLIDLLTGDDIDLLANNSYEFVGSPRDNENRFVVRFSENAGNDIFAYQNNNDIIVNGEGMLQVYDVMGRFVGNYEVNGNEHISASNFSTGVYIFRLIGNDIKTQKIVVR